MRTEVHVLGLLVAALAVATAEMRTWTFEQSGKTIEGEVIGFAGQGVTMRRADGKLYSVPIAYFTLSNRIDLAAERAKQWKEVEVVKLEGTVLGGRYKRCTVQGKEVNGEVLIQFLPAPAEAILNNRKQQAARIAELSDRIEQWDRAVKREDAVTGVPPGSRGAHLQMQAARARRARVNVAIVDMAGAKSDLAKQQAAQADYIEKTRAATTVRMKNTGTVYQGLAVWECFDPRKPQQ